MKKALTLALFLALGLALAVASQAAVDDFTVAKDFRNTSVCFEQDNDLDGLFNEDPVDFAPVDNDLDGLFNEDPVDGIDNDFDTLIDEDPVDFAPVDNDLDGLFNEDPVDCPDGTCLGFALPMNEDGNYTLEAVLKKNGKVSSYNPGQYYAVSTVYVNDSVDKLTIEDDFCECTDIGTLSPSQGGGSVVIVQVGDDGIAYQILDAKSEEVTFGDCNVTVELEDVEAGTTILMYVKFAPAQKHGYFEAGTCVNTNAASINMSGVEYDLPSASATLELVQKVEE
jgi:hypothetical protein